MDGKKDRAEEQRELYDLSKDLSEQSDLARVNPERLAKLVALGEARNGEMREPLF